MKKRPTIRFSVDPEQKAEIDKYAKAKGFDNASNLARVALFRYIARNKLSGGKRSTACKPDEGLEE